MVLKSSKLKTASFFVLALSLIAPSANAAAVTQLGAYGIATGQILTIGSPDVIQVADNRGRVIRRNRAGDRAYNGPRGNRDRRHFNTPRYNGRDDHRPRFKRGYQGTRYQRQGYRRSNDGWWFPLAAFALGAAIANDHNSGRTTTTYRNWSHIPQGNMRQHDNWCDRQYRSYSRSTKTFQPYHGPRKLCNSPYDRI